MPVDQLRSDAERRVLAHLPAYRTASQYDDIDKQRAVEYRAYQEEANPDVPADELPVVELAPYPRSFTVAEVAARLDDDPHAVHTDEESEDQVSLGVASVDLVETYLRELEARGLAAESSGEWSMTEQGLAALQA